MGFLAGWRACPRCTARLDPGGNRAECTSCGSVYYAHSTPAVAALVLGENGRMLLARRARDPDAGLWDLLGGFLEEGESPIDGLRRELLEETGLAAEPREFLGSFVDTYGEGPRAASVLNLVWSAQLEPGEPTPADDVSELRWFSPDALPPPHEVAFRWVAPFLAGLVPAR